MRSRPWGNRWTSAGLCCVGLTTTVERDITRSSELDNLRQVLLLAMSHALVGGWNLQKRVCDFVKLQPSIVRQTPWLAAQPRQVATIILVHRSRRAFETRGYISDLKIDGRIQAGNLHFGPYIRLWSWCHRNGGNS